MWLNQRTTEPSASLIDSYISAEIPDYVTDPVGYVLVDEFMVHGPCGELNPRCPYMRNDACSKRFPRSFNNETSN